MSVEIAWCAGFFDGEEYVGYHRSRPSVISGKVSPLMWACVSQTSANIEVLDYFQSVIGFGKLYGPYSTGNGKTRHDLRYPAREVEALFNMLKPYLRHEKTKDFLEAMEKYKNHNPEFNIEDMK